jgi:hypothetical protein
MYKINFFLTLSALSVVLGCKRADPNAYTKDPILIDYQAQLQATQVQVEEAKKSVLEAEKELKNSQPQKGQAAIHKKKMEEQVERLSKLNQQVIYWQVRVESRAKEAQVEYLDYFKKGKSWPDQEAINSYHAQKRLRLNRLQWDQKARISELKNKDNQKSTEKSD